MSDFGLFEADTDAQQAPQRQQRHAANKLANAISDVADQYGPFLMGSTGKDEFEDRWHHAKNDIRKTIEAAGAFPNTGVMRRVHNAMKREFVATLGEDNSDDPTKAPEGGKDEPKTINDKQYKKVKDGDPSVKDDVKTNTGDGSDAEGKNPSSTTGPQDDPRDSGPERKKSSRYAENFDGDLVPKDNFDAYLDSVDQGGPEKVQHNFSDGDDSGEDKPSNREARRLAVDLYKDFAEATGLRVAKLSTLNHYADTGISDSDYFLLANLIRQADENCDCDDDDDDSSDSSSESSSDSDTDTDGPEGPDTDSDGPPKGAAEKGGESEDSDSGDDDASDSDGGSDSGGENPFAESDSDSDAPSEDAGPPADDAGPVGDPQAPPGPPDLGPEDGGDPAGPPPEAQAPPGPPMLDDAPPLAQDDFSGVDELTPDAAGSLPPGTELVQVEQIEDALGLPPGTLEQILADSIAHGGPPAPHGAGPVASRRYVAFGEGADPAAGGQAVAPAAPAPAAGAPAPAMPGPEDGALLDQASQAVTNLVDQKTQEYQTIIDPLQQALQAIQFAQQVEQAANPLDVTPPEGTVDVNPQSAVDPAAQAGAASVQAPAPQTSAGPPPPGPGGAPAPAPAAGGGDSGGGESDSSEKKEARRLALRRHAFKLAQFYGLSEQGYNEVLAAMSRKHYQHVAEAIQTLPPEHRMGIAASLADMFSTDNVRFNTGQFMGAAGVPMGQDALHLAGNPRDRAGDAWADGKDRASKDAEDYDTDPDNWEEREARRLGLRQGSRHPFVIRSRTTGGGRTAGETWKPPGGDQSLDAFEFPGQGEKPEFSDNNKLTDMGKPKKAGGVVEDYQRFDKRRTDEGLNVGGEGEVDGFLQRKKVGPRAQNKLHETLSLEPHQKAASFAPKVAGWEFDDHLNGYVTHVRQAFHCPCGQAHTPPSHGMCRCGKLWYTYAIGTGQHLANGNEAEMFLAREIPVRENVIMANRQFQSAEEYNNASGQGPFQDYAEDVEFYSDDEIDQSTPHAPGETDMDTTKSASRYAEIEHEDPDHTDPAFGGWPFEEHKPKRNDGKKTGASYGEDDHNVVERDGEKFCSACDAMLWDPNVHHCPAKQASRSFFADWTEFSEDDNKGYEEGPKDPPSTTPGKQPPKDWAKRDDKGNWVKPQFK